MYGTAARLGGSGALSGNLTISDGAKISPGSSAGTLTLAGQVSFTTGGAHPACVIELAGAASFDQISLADGATLALGSDLTDLQLSLGYTPVYGDTFRIVNSSGSGQYSGTFRNLPATRSVATATYAGQTHYFAIFYDGAGKTIDITVVTPYLAWAYGKGLADGDAGFNADPDADGISNGVEFVIGGEPNPAHPDSYSNALLPQTVLDHTYLRVSYRRSHQSAYLNPGVEYDADLVGPWTAAVAGVGGITVTVDGFSPGLDRVEVWIPRTHAVAGRLFARLAVTNPDF